MILRRMTAIAAAAVMLAAAPVQATGRLDMAGASAAPAPAADGLNEPSRLADEEDILLYVLGAVALSAVIFLLIKLLNDNDTNAVPLEPVSP